MAVIFLFTNITLLSCVLFAQVEEHSGRFGRTVNNLFTAFSETIEWYDMPIAAAYLLRHQIQPDLDDKLRIPASSFEMSLQRRIGETGRFSFGSIDKDIIPFNLIYVRTAFSLGTDLFFDGITDKDDYKKIILFNKALIYTHTITELVKNWTSRSRPDNGDSRSFFSGHSSTTFTAASFLYREVDDYIDELQIFSENKNLRTALKVSAFSTLYGWAGYVAYSRMRDNKHYLSDVLIGAAVGTFIGNFIYCNYFNEEDAYQIGFNIIDKVPSVYLNITF